MLLLRSQLYITLVFILMSQAARAADWTGNVNTSWKEPNNWNPVDVPDTSVESASISPFFTIDLDINTTIDDLAVTNSVLQSGAFSLTVFGDTDLGSDAIFNIGTSTLTLDGPTTFQDGATITGNAVGVVHQNGNLVVDGATSSVNTVIYDWDGESESTATTIQNVSFIFEPESLDTTDSEFNGTLVIESPPDSTFAVRVDLASANNWTMAGTLMLDAVGNDPAIEGDTMNVSGSITAVGENHIAADVAFESTAIVSLADVSDILILDGSVSFDGGSYTGAGTLVQEGNATVISDTTIAVDVFNWDGMVVADEVTTITSGATLTINADTIDVADNTFHGNVTIENASSLDVGTLAGQWAVAGQMTLDTSGGTVEVSGDTVQLNGDLKVEGEGTANLTAPIIFGATSDTDIQIGNELHINANAGSLVQSIEANSASFTGNGQLVIATTGELTLQDGADVAVDLVNEGSLIIGSSPGTATADDYTQMSTGTLNIEIDSTDFDKLMVTNTAMLDGTLDIQTEEGFIPTVDPNNPGMIGDTFTIVDANSIAGDFAVVNGRHVDNGVFYDVTTTTDVTLGAFQALKGDTNGDRTVDITDFQNFLSGFTGSGNSWEVGDFNDDGAVDITDFADHFLPNMSTSYGPGQVVIPEPASLVLMGIAVVWCLAGISFGTERNPPR